MAEKVYAFQITVYTLERLESYSSKTKIHKDCMGVCEIISFDRKD